YLPYPARVLKAQCFLHLYHARPYHIGHIKPDGHNAGLGRNSSHSLSARSWQHPPEDMPAHSNLLLLTRFPDGVPTLHTSVMVLLQSHALPRYQTVLYSGSSKESRARHDPFHAQRFPVHCCSSPYG